MSSTSRQTAKNTLAEAGVHQHIVPVFVQEVEQRNVATSRKAIVMNSLKRLIHQVVQLRRHDPHIGQLADDGG